MKRENSPNSNDIKHFRSHPWHGVSVGEDAPRKVNCYIEMVPTDTVKYELDKVTGLLKVDRPQKYSSLCPSLYGFVPQTYCGNQVGEFCASKTNMHDVVGDHDPMDICVLTEKVIVRGDIIVRALPIGGFRIIDRGEADDKIVAVMLDDFIFGKFADIADCPKSLIERLRHYFLTYKDVPGHVGPSNIQITHIYGRDEAFEVIEKSMQDYRDLTIC